MKKKIAISLILCLALILSGCVRYEIGISFKEDGSGTAKLGLWYPESTMEMIAGMSEGDQTAEEAAEEAGLVKRTINGKLYYGMSEDHEFASSSEFVDAFNSSDVTSDLDSDEQIMRSYIKDGYKWFELRFMMDDYADDYDAEGETQTELDSLGENTEYELTLYAPYGVTVEGTKEYKVNSDKSVTIDVMKAARKGDFHIVIKMCICKVTDIPFKDVKGDAWYRTFLKNAYLNGLIAGISEEKFSPDSSVTHAQIMAMLCSLMTSLDKQYEDFFYEYFYGTGEPWYEPYEYWAWCFGISDGRFDNIANEPASREEISYYISNMLDVIEYDSRVKTYTNESALNDIAESEYSGDIKSVQNAGIMGGYTDGSFRPRNTVTRAEMTVVLENLRAYLADKNLSEWNKAVDSFVENWTVGD